MSGSPKKAQLSAGRARNSTLQLPGSSHSQQPAGARPQSGASRSSKTAVDRNPHEEENMVGRTKSHSMSSEPVALVVPKEKSAQDSQRTPRTIPPWVTSVEVEKLSQQPKLPNDIHPARHLWVPSPKPNTRQGCQYDHLRSAEPVAMKHPMQHHASTWREFAMASAPKRTNDEMGSRQIVDVEWMKENWPDLDTPWELEETETDPEKEAGFWLLDPNQRKARRKGIYRAIMKNPIVPLVVRLIVLTFCVMALGLACTIFQKTRAYNRDEPGVDCDTLPSTYLAIIVDVVAIIYIVYITQDEYTSKPLGLRSHRAKMRLIFMDLIFIVFASANLSLAFQSLTDENWACRAAEGKTYKQTKCPVDSAICRRQKVLTATLVIALCAWIVTFAISTLRVIERIAR